MPTFSISIPTFNRPGHLRRTIERLRQIGAETVPVTIVDNFGDAPALEIVESMELPPGWITVNRNPANIGLVANILRCIELAETDFVWVLGDDDEPDQEAITVIAEMLKTNGDACFFNFRSTCSEERNECRVMVGLNDYIAGVERFSGQMFISSCVFHVPSFKKLSRFAYQNIYSGIGFLAPVLLTLSEGGKAVLSEKCLVKWGEMQDGWQLITVSKGIMSILELPCDWEPKTFERFSRLLAEALILHPRGELIGFIRNPFGFKNFYRRFFYSHLMQKALLVKRPLKAYFYVMIFKILAWSPDFALHILGKLFKQKKGIHSYLNSFRRI